MPKHGIHMQPAQHEALVSVEIWQKAQARLDGRALAPARKDIRDEFPLRGFICCDACGHPMTAAFSKGRAAHYGYYKCFQRDCSLNGKSIRKEQVETDFEELLKSFKPGEQLIAMLRVMFENAWSQQAGRSAQLAAEARKELQDIEAKVGRLVSRIVDTDQPGVVAAYEAEIAKLNARKAGLAQAAARKHEPVMSFEKTFRTALAFLSNPWNLWNSDVPTHRRLLLRLAFTSPIRYCRNEGFRTAGIAEPLRVLGLIAQDKGGMVEEAGFEPT